MVYLSGALLPKSSKSLRLQKEGMEIPPVNLNFEGGKSRKFWLKENLGACFVVYTICPSQRPFAFSLISGVGVLPEEASGFRKAVGG